jgi:hypothetical protein
MYQYILNLNKWKLVAVLLIIHFPLGLYLNFPVYSPNYTYNFSIFYYQAGTLVILAGTLYLWMSVSELVLKGLFRLLGQDFLLSFRILPMLATFVVATIMAFTFVWLAGQLLIGAEWFSHAILDRAFRVLPVNTSDEFLALYQRSNIGYFLLLMLSTFYLIAYQQSTHKAKQMEIRVAELAKEKVHAQLLALKDQLSPHFLFNSFSILSNLVHHDPVLAERFIQELSKTYRYILEQKTYDTVPLAVELSFMTSYIFLLQLRFKGKFTIQQKIPEDANRWKIAPVTLQLLIENAVTHNQMSEERPLLIMISIENSYLNVSNTLSSRKQSSTSTGLGLKNIAKRYAALTDQPVVIEKNDTTFYVKIPLLP